METVHSAIAWYQTKIGSYDKQLWEQSVEKKLQKQPHFVLQNAPRKPVHLRTEYIDVDMIRGSAFAKTKPQVQWVYVSRKAIARVLFFPFYYNWWVHQTSKKLYAVLLILYMLQVVTVLVYLSNFEHMEDELSFTEVIMPSILMFLLCLIHSQTVLAHINHKPPKHNKTISGLTRKPSPKPSSHKVTFMGNISTCQDDLVEAPRIKKQQFFKQPSGKTNSSSSMNLATDAKNLPHTMPSSIDMEGSLMSCSVSDYDLKPAINPAQNEASLSASGPYRNKRIKSNRSTSSDTVFRSKESSHSWGKDEINIYGVHGNWGDGTANSGKTIEKSGCCYNLLDNLPNLLTVEKIFHGVRDKINDNSNGGRQSGLECCSKTNGAHDTGSYLPSKKASSQGKNGNSVEEMEIVMCKDLNKSAVKNAEIMAHENTREIVELQTCNDFLESSAGICDFKSSDKHAESIMCSHKYAADNSFTKDKDVSVESRSDEQNKTDKIHCSCKTLQNSCRIAKFCESCTRTRRNPSDLAKVTQYHCHSYCKVPVIHPSKTDNLNFGCPEKDDHKLDKEITSLNHLDQRSPTSKITSHSSQSGRNYKMNYSPAQVSPTEGEGDTAEYKHLNAACVGYSNHEPCPACGHTIAQMESPVNPAIGAAGLDGMSVSQSAESLCPSAASICPKFTSLCGNINCHGEATRHLQSVNDWHNKQELSSLRDKHSSHSLALKIEENSPELIVYLDSVRTGETDITKGHNFCRNASRDLNSLKQVTHRPLSFLSGNHENTRTNNQTSHHYQQDHLSLKSHLQCFSELFAQEILNDDSLREMSCSTLVANSDLYNSSSSTNDSSSVSSTCSVSATDNTPQLTTFSSPPGEATHFSYPHSAHSSQTQHQDKTPSPNIHSPRCSFHNPPSYHSFHENVQISCGLDDVKDNPLEESLELIQLSEEERHSDDLLNYNPSDSDVDSDGSINEDNFPKFEEKWKKLRFQDLPTESDCTEETMQPQENESIISVGMVKKSGKSETNKVAASAKNGNSIKGSGSRSVVGILTRQPSPLKDLASGRKSNNASVNVPSGSDKAQNESRSQLRRRRRTPAVSYETADGGRFRGAHGSSTHHSPGCKHRRFSSSENDIGGMHISEESNKTTQSSEEWEDRIQTDETTSSAYSSNSEMDAEEKLEEKIEENMDNKASSIYVTNLLQGNQQNGATTSSSNITQPDRVSCMIWEGTEYKKMDLTAMDIGWAIIEKVDSLPETSDYFLIGVLFSVVISVVPLVFRAYANRDLPTAEAIMTWSWLVAKMVDISALVLNSYSWRQYLLMVNGICQRLCLSLIFFFLLSVADRTFKQRLLYAKHFSYLTSSRRARKFLMPHFRLNKVRNIKIWLSLRSYLKRRGPQRSVDVIVSASFMFTVSIVCLISLQMLKDTENYLDYLCNWELLVWCIALGVFLMRFMTLGLKINKKYRNLSVLITEQINLYLQMEQKPHKKEELILANNVLRLAEDLLKELESPFKISGFSANPLIYNIMRIVVLSAFSAVLTEVLGFKLRLHKIKFKG